MKKKNSDHKKQSKIIESFFKLDFTLLLFYLLVIIYTLSYTNNFFKLKDISNSFLLNNQQLLYYGQFVIYFFIIIIFVYFSRKLILKSPWSRLDNRIIIILFLLVTILHGLAFNPALDTNGDNASYIIFAKAFVQEGGFYSIYLPGNELVYDPQTAIGLPIMLVPIYLIFGVNILSIKLFMILLTLSTFYLLYLILKEIMGNYAAVVLTLFHAVHPYIVSFSSMIMTEIPYIFWSLLSIYALFRYESAKGKINYLYLLVLIISLIMLYFTRAVGIGLAISIILYWFIKYDFLKNLLRGNFKWLRSIEFKKIIALTVILVLFFALYQFYLHTKSEKTQASILLSSLSSTKILNSLKEMFIILPQNIFSGDMVRWKIAELDIKWIVIIIFTLIGLVKSLLKKELFGYYFVITTALLIIANPSFSPIVFSRYMVIFIPFLFLFLFTGILILKKFFNKKFVMLIICMIFLVNILGSFSGDAYFIQKAHTGKLYPEPYHNYIKSAIWAKDNLPKNSVIACRKERIFYLFSGHKGFKHTTYHGGTSPEHEKAREEKFERYDADYVIIDSFNSSTRNFVLPWIQKKPELFTLVQVIGDKNSGPTYILKVNKWWE